MFESNYYRIEIIDIPNRLVFFQMFESNYYRIEILFSSTVMFFISLWFESNYYRIEMLEDFVERVEREKFESNYYRIEMNNGKAGNQFYNGLNRTIIGLKYQIVYHLWA